ncbi:unnamed protein product [Nippostrongylus brasiliensis]|uniref:Col_cuticle_N domain-containing protein n=1 Tax=Nippostrongylus brasiliensis TaxID=27835 RepID=A0A0N4YJ53_NIPBR|nr:unnamed protein product [Nippostrongylus brasiliensis]
MRSVQKGLGLVMAVSAAGFSVILACICIYLVFYFMAVTRNAILDVTDAIVPSSETVKNIQPTCWYALTVAVISSLYNISPEEVSCCMQKMMRIETKSQIENLSNKRDQLKKISLRRHLLYSKIFIYSFNTSNDAPNKRKEPKQ